MSGDTGRRPSWLRDPLVHFLAAGALLVAIEQVRAPEAVATTPDRPEIRVQASAIESMRAAFVARNGRPPGTEQLQAALDAHVRSEVLVREALAADFHRSDLIVRRRLEQKMEFLLHDLAVADEPTEADVRAHIAADPARYAPPTRLSFHHVFFSRDRRGATVRADAEAAWARMQGAPRGDAPWTLGDPFLRERVVRGRSEVDVAGVFGADFAAAVTTLEPGGWRGPVASAYGLHLVWIDARETGGGEVDARTWARALEDLRAARRDAAFRREVARLVAGYAVRVEAPGR